MLRQRKAVYYAANQNQRLSYQSDRYYADRQRFLDYALQQRSAYRWVAMLNRNLALAQALREIMRTQQELTTFAESVRGVPVDDLVRQIAESFTALDDFWQLNPIRLAEAERQGVTPDQIIGTLRQLNIHVGGFKRLFKLWRNINDGALLAEFCSQFIHNVGLFGYGMTHGVDQQRAMLSMSEQELNRLRSSNDLGDEGPEIPGGLLNKRRDYQAHHGRDERPDFRAIAHSGTEKDVIDMCLEMVNASRNPEAVAWGLITALKPLAQKHTTNGAPKRRATAGVP